MEYYKIKYYNLLIKISIEDDKDEIKKDINKLLHFYENNDDDTINAVNETNIINLKNTNEIEEIEEILKQYLKKKNWNYFASDIKYCIHLFEQLQNI